MRGDRVARVLTEVFAPAVLAAVLPLVVAVHAASTAAKGLGWGLLAATFCSLLPYGMILRGVRRGQLSDRHIGERAQRTGPLLFGLGSVLAGLALLVVTGAPRELLALIVASFAGGAVATGVNHFWKSSVHAGVAAGSSVVLVLIFGPALLVTAVGVAAVGWSRVRLGDHTVAQVLVGTAIGAVIAGVVFGLAR
ncbi:phosphatase PAP2 family protein [Paractinoplanes globisporus]|uniref:Phosphatase PAP2 family protein n=1 Tax=Paractinoplanes globisporus TaxID=113565 RepID=A0ABW6W5W0_9ACTN|nr:phosphatase PAP2 family protein [Actinoplanes globisporus]